MRIEPDIVIYNREGLPTVVVEIKSKSGTDAEWAAKMRQNLLQETAFPLTPYFLLALPDQFYLWTPFNSGIDALPSYRIDPAPLLRSYYDRTGIPTRELRGASFELVVTSWLGELMRLENFSETTINYTAWLVDSGFLEALKGGRIVWGSILA